MPRAMKTAAGGPASEAAPRPNLDVASLGVEDVEQTKTRTKAELMEAVVEPSNMRRAYARVVRNKGAAGVDDLGVSDLGDLLRSHWPTIKAKLLSGAYQPQPVRAVTIPKPNGGERQLGIPTVLDRLIQQAVQQVLSPIFEPLFSDHSYGFRPGRSAQQAVLAAQAHVAAGRDWVVDVDLKQFFDHVHHEHLMRRLREHIADTRVLTLIRKYLKVGMMVDGLHSPRREGTPQGGPLSPLLSNIVLNDLDRELERRQHCFVRYADDVVIYVQSERAGQRVLASVERFLRRRLHLELNREKSAVARPSTRSFLGYVITKDGGLRVSMASRTRLTSKLRPLFRMARGWSLRRTIERLNRVLRGWAAYFQLVTSRHAMTRLDAWIRRKLRCMLWRQWKSPATRARYLMRLGLAPARAWQSSFNGRGPWWNAGAFHMNQAVTRRRLARIGLSSLVSTVQQLQRSP